MQVCNAFCISTLLYSCAGWTPCHHASSVWNIFIFAAYMQYLRLLMEKSLQWNTAGDWPHLLGKYSDTMVGQVPRPCCKYAIQQIAPAPW